MRQLIAKPDFAMPSSSWNCGRQTPNGARNAVARPSPLRIAARDAVCDRVREHRRLLEQAEMLYELIIQARRTAGEPDTEEASCRAQ